MNNDEHNEGVLSKIVSVEDMSYMDDEALKEHQAWMATREGRAAQLAMALASWDAALDDEAAGEGPLTDAEAAEVLSIYRSPQHHETRWSWEFRTPDRRAEMLAQVRVRMFGGAHPKNFTGK